MSYTLWSHGRVVGRTDLDLPHVLANVRMGFIEPTPDGETALADASRVPNALATLKRTIRRAGIDGPESQQAHDDVRAAFDRRAALELELRDAAGRPVPVRWIQVNDLVQDVMDDLEDEEHVEDVESLEDVECLKDLEEFDEVEFDWSPHGELEADVALAANNLARDVAPDAPEMEMEPVEIIDQPWSLPDERWGTMRYHTMIFLLSPADLP
jgi:hypothetical protein